MAKALLGRKLGMSQMFAESGEVIPVTLIVAEKNAVTLRRTEDTDGYAAVQLALPRKNTKAKAQKPNESEKLTPNRMKALYAARREFSVELEEGAETVGVEQFEVGDVVQVSGISKGKGYAGVVKRHHFKGGPASHGHRHVLRQAGSIGGAFPQHVFKGMRMAGRMGGERVTVKNLEIVKVDAEKNVLAVKGAVPGTRNSVVEVVSIEVAKADKD